MSAIAWMVAPPQPPEAWPYLVRRHGLDTAVDQVPYTDADLARGLSPEESERHRGGRPALQVRTAETARRHAGETSADRAQERRQYREGRAAKAGIVYLPLEPGQKRRRRAGPDGQPIARAKQSARPPAPDPVYRGPARAPGEMTYGAAKRLLERVRDGELVDMGDLQRAIATIEAVAG